MSSKNKTVKPGNSVRIKITAKRNRSVAFDLNLFNVPLSNKFSALNEDEMDTSPQADAVPSHKPKISPIVITNLDKDIKSILDEFVICSAIRSENYEHRSKSVHEINRRKK